MRQLRIILIIITVCLGIAAIWADSSIFSIGCFSIAGICLLLGRTTTVVADNSHKIEATIENQVYQDDFEKAFRDFTYLQSAKGTLINQALLSQLNQMQVIANKILQYLRQHPDRIPVARQFINYYQDRAVTLMKQYLTIQETNLNTEEVKETRKRMKTIFANLPSAYESQFAKIVGMQIMDMNAEMDVVEQIMTEDGIYKELPSETGYSGEGKDLQSKAPVESQGKGSFWTPKNIGIAAATILGAIGVFSLMNKKNDEKS